MNDILWWNDNGDTSIWHMEGIFHGSALAPGQGDPEVATNEAGG
jgi:hypothetical protein